MSEIMTSLRAVFLVSTFVFTGCTSTYQPASSSLNKMGRVEAKKQIQSSLQGAILNGPGLYGEVQGISFNNSAFEIKGRQLSGNIGLSFNEKFELREIEPLGDTATILFGRQFWTCTLKRVEPQRVLNFTSAENLRGFVDAIHALQHIPGFRDIDFATFKAKATAWRELANKPPLAVDAERHRILAENSLKEQNFDKALEHYEAALGIEPLWPEGHYNAAMICSELQNYAEASNHLRYYLELLPDAPDAQAAREKMIIWEDKAKSP